MQNKNQHIARRSTIAEQEHKREKHAPELMEWQRKLLAPESAAEPILPASRSAHLTSS
jgi:hypothetical protein